MKAFFVLWVIVVSLNTAATIATFTWWRLLLLIVAVGSLPLHYYITKRFPIER